MLKIRVIFFSLLLLLSVSSIVHAQANNTGDSLALVDIYNSLNGPNWAFQNNWLTAAPIDRWHGVSVENGRVTEVFFFPNELAGTIPASIGNLTELKSLTLDGNLITGILPPEIGALSHLTRLYISTTQISGIIPPSFGNLQSLTTLSLFYNNLSGEIPETLANLSQLNFMDLSYNQLTGSIPATLGNLSQLNILYAYHNRLTGTIPSTLGNLSNLEDVQFDRNQLTGNIPSSFGNLPKLQRLELQKNKLSGPIPPALQNLGSLNGHPSIYTDISNNGFTFDGMEIIEQLGPSNVYSPQAVIPLHHNGNMLSVSAGGRLASDSFMIFKDGVRDTLQVGDSVYHIKSPGYYYFTVLNSRVPKLTLFTDTIAVAGILLADSLVTISANINGTDLINYLTEPYKKLMLTVTPGAGINGLSGNVSATVNIDPAIAVYNNQPYVQRHFDIVPADNAAVATATVTLYFTQQDFDNFNAFPAHGLDLPAGPADAAGIANLRVYQYHGFSTTSLPGSYSGVAVEIDPDDANIVWNTSSQYWEVSFAVNGFSGFFVSSINNALLPLRLLSFTGKMNGKEAVLQWTTASEINTAYFEIERGSDVNSFNITGKLTAAGNATTNKTYTFTDLPGGGPLYFYRLKMVDIDGKSSFSKIIKLTKDADQNNFGLYPNPGKDFVVVTMIPSQKQTTIIITDMSGKIVRRIQPTIASSQTIIDLKHLPPGNYKVIIGTEKIVSKILVIE